jgi:hypothetical protein
MGRVGLIDITVGNAARLGASQRSTTRRCASHHIATQRASRWGHPGGSRAFSAAQNNASYRQRALTRVSCPMIASIDTKLEPFIGSNVPPRKPLTRSVETQL